MGYMGFGLQKWIYQRRARKPFSKETQAGYNTIELPGGKKFTNAGIVSEGGDNLDERIETGKQRLRRQWLNYSYRNMAFALIIAGIVLWIIISFAGQLDLFKIKQSEKLAREKADKEAAYVVCIRTGHQHYKAGRYEEAITEYRQAVSLFPERDEASETLANALYNTCIKNGEHCLEAISIYENLYLKTKNKNFSFKKNTLKRRIINKQN
ncbi:MAG: tetratricopeptide repeat protein [Lentimicrobium sp.]|nr:tetratricopeptide repeat protein [Lentimicrobium sp.]